METRKVEQSIDTRIANIKLLDIGIVYLKYREGDYLKVEPEDLLENVMSIRKLSSGKIVPAMIDTRNIKHLNFTKEAREFAASERVKEFKKADAVLVDSYFNRLSANIYLSFYKPAIPTRLFNNESDALKWLTFFI